MQRLIPWLLRAAWAALPFVAGPALAAALDERSGAVRSTASVALWVSWVLVLVAALVAHPISLTVVRVASPAAVALAAAALAGPATTGAGIAAVVATGVAAAVAFLPEIGIEFVNGPAYPNERRFPLRPPGPLLLGPLPLAWALAVGPLGAGVLLLATSQWVVGGVVTILGAVLALVLGRALHGLSLRWLVFVPAGVVLHDPFTLADPVLFPKDKVRALRLAVADTTARDLTQRAFGMALEVDLVEPATVGLARAARGLGETITVDAFLFTPTRPGAVLREAAARGL